MTVSECICAVYIAMGNSFITINFASTVYQCLCHLMSIVPPRNVKNFYTSAKPQSERYYLACIIAFFGDTNYLKQVHIG